MSVVLIFIHTIAALLLIVVILMQSGRGGGLTEGFAPAESLFGAKTNQFMVRATTTMAGVFLVTCLTLAYLNAQRTTSLIPDTIEEEAAQGGPVDPTVVPQEPLKEAAIPPIGTQPIEVAPVQEIPVTVTPVDPGQDIEVQVPAAETEGN